MIIIIIIIIITLILLRKLRLVILSFVNLFELIVNYLYFYFIYIFTFIFLDPNLIRRTIFFCLIKIMLS